MVSLISHCFSLLSSRAESACKVLQERYQCHLCLLELVPVGGSGPGILSVLQVDMA